jgi:hypothetical protein
MVVRCAPAESYCYHNRATLSVLLEAMDDATAVESDSSMQDVQSGRPGSASRHPHPALCVGLLLLAHHLFSLRLFVLAHQLEFPAAFLIQWTFGLGSRLKRQSEILKHWQVVRRLKRRTKLRQLRARQEQWTVAKRLSRLKRSIILWVNLQRPWLASFISSFEE